MKIVNERPPMWDQINAEFHVERNARVIFCWGDTIYNPGKQNIPGALIDHEQIHSDRQLTYKPDLSAHDSTTAWWDRYIRDKAFRLAEEFPAHVAEYKGYCRRNHGRGERHRYLVWVAQKLASPLYGGLLTSKAALAAITSGRLETHDGQ